MMVITLGLDSVVSLCDYLTRFTLSISSGEKGRCETILLENTFQTLLESCVVCSNKHFDKTDIKI